MAGVDMSMVPYDPSFYEYCVDLAKNDDSFLQRVNDATMRILNVKNKLGLLDTNYDNIYPDPADLNKIGTKESEDFNLEAARESIILVKNQKNVLPLNKNSNKKILITGPTGNLRKVLNGGWSYTWQGNDESTYDFGRPKFTLYQAISKKTNNVVYKEGANFTDLTNLNETIDEAKTSDYIVLSIGEDGYAGMIFYIYSI
jgi:beta-glucosidase